MADAQEAQTVEPNETGPVEEWVTLREAERLTGVPVRTLRSWYGSGKVQSRMVPGSHGPQRELLLEEVRAKAADRGRPIILSPVDQTQPEPEPAQSPVVAVPEGMQLVPRDAWVSMLEQVGNLHEAGQQLAKAMERAGNAEATAKFQTERRHELEREVAELRAQLAGQPLPHISEDAAIKARTDLEKLRAHRQEDKEAERLPDIDQATVDQQRRELEQLRPEPRRPLWLRMIDRTRRS